MTIDRYSYEELKKNNMIVFEAVVGSHSYGTNIETSDVDKFFIYIAYLDDILIDDYPKWVNVDGSDDHKGYELSKFIELTIKQAPNIIELLHADEQFVEFCHPMFKELVVNRRDLFLSNKVAFSFGSYAKTQIDKAQGTNKKFMNPMDGPRKSLLEFAWIPYKHGSMSLKQYMEEFYIPEGWIGLSGIDHMKYTYHMFIDPMYKKVMKECREYARKHRPFWKKFLMIDFSNKEKEMYVANFKAKVDSILEGFPGGYDLDDLHIVNFNSIFNGPVDIDGVQPKMSSIPKGLKSVTVVQFNLDGFQKYCDDYKEYHKWLKNRNMQRFVENTTVNKQYDCYLDSETEYLTETGWKKYDDIDNNELLLTISRGGNMIYSNIIDRIKKEYTGDIYSYQNAYTKFSVTPNHNLYLSKANRGLKNNYSIDRQMNNSEFITVENYFKNKNSHYCFYNAIDRREDDLAGIEDDYLKLMGMFLSDGSLFFNASGNANQLSIGQSEGGKICEYIKTISYPYSTTKSFRKEKWEYIYLFEKCLAERIHNDCAHGSYNKKLPVWANNLSYRQLSVLIEAMFQGDGYESKKGYKVYYTVSKDLADSLQTACLCNGITTKIMGPYTNIGQWGTVTLYHLYFPIEEFNINWLNKKKSTEKSKSGWTISKVENKYISCFTTSSNLLITRNDNKISIQGNTKNMMHCHRLLDMCIEILSGQGVNVLRPNREELLSIRLGENTYQTLVDAANVKMKKITELHKTSTLQDTCDPRLVASISLEMRKSFYGI